MLLTIPSRGWDKISIVQMKLNAVFLFQENRGITWLNLVKSNCLSCSTVYCEEGWVSQWIKSCKKISVWLNKLNEVFVSLHWGVKSLYSRDFCKSCLSLKDAFWNCHLIIHNSDYSNKLFSLMWEKFWLRFSVKNAVTQREVTENVLNTALAKRKQWR